MQKKTLFSGVGASAWQGDKASDDGCTLDALLRVATAHRVSRQAGAAPGPSMASRVWFSSTSLKSFGRLPGAAGQPVDQDLEPSGFSDGPLARGRKDRHLYDFSMRTAQALYSAVIVMLSKASMVSQLALFSRK
jgi:hypothetical protein